MRQVNTSICTGMGKLGKQRLTLYRARVKAKGYRSFSAYVVKLLDQQLEVDLPRGKSRKKKTPMEQNGYIT